MMPQSKQVREQKDKSKAYPAVGESMPAVGVLRQNTGSVYQDVQGLVCPISQGLVTQSVCFMEIILYEEFSLVD